MKFLYIVKYAQATVTNNIEDLLYRGDSLERMGEMSGRLREDSKKYRKAAVRINCELLLKQYEPIGAVGFIMVVLIWWRFFWHVAITSIERASELCAFATNALFAQLYLTKVCHQYIMVWPR